jgi:hypothetical protein
MPPILESATLDIPLTGGLAEKADPRVLPPGSYAVLENVVQDKAGAFRKRYGFGTVFPITPGGELLESPSNMGAFREQPFAISNPPGSAPKIYQLDGDSWRARSPVEFGRVVSSRSVIRPEGTVFFERIHRVPTSPRPRVVAAWLESDANFSIPGAGSKISYSVMDAETGVEAFRPTSVFSSSSDSFASCVIGDRVIIAQRASTTLVRLIAINGTTGESSVLTTAAFSGPVQGVDVCPYSSSHVALAIGNGPGLRIEIRNASSGLLTASLDVGATTSPLVAIAFLPGSPGNFWAFAAGVGGAPQVLVATSSGPTSLVPGGISSMSTSLAGFLTLAPFAFDLPGTGSVCLVGASTLPMTELHLLDSNGDLIEISNVPWAPMTTKPIFAMGRLWGTFAPLALQVPTAFGRVDVSSVSLASLEVTEAGVTVRHCATVGRLRTALLTSQAYVVPSLSFDDAEPSFDVPSRVTLDVGRNFRTGFDWTNVSTNQYVAGSHQSQPCIGSLALSGSHVSWYDGGQASELGYLHAPQVVNAAFSPGGGSVGVGTYDFFACYEFTDEAGNLHRSAPSAPFRLAVTSAGSSVTVTLATAGMTGHGCLIHVFRTLAGPGPDVYRLTSTATAPRNTNSASTVSFVTTSSDANVAALGLGFLYSSSQIPARTPPPANAFLAHRGRAWLAAADEDGKVYYSKPIVQGLAPEFADEFVVSLPQASGPVTALAPLDSGVIAFTARQVFYVTGEGRSASGQGADYQAELVPSEHGCINAASVVATESGAFFQSSRGICMVGRDLTVSYAGAPVEELVSKTYRFVRSAFVDQARRRVLWLCRSAEDQTAQSTILVYDLDMRLWTNWLVPSETITGQAMASGKHWLSTPDSGFGREQASSRDFGPSYVRAVIETPWLRVGALGGHQRTRRWALVASRLDPCQLQVDVFVDFNPTSAQSFDIDLGATTEALDPDRLRFVGTIAPQKHSAIKLRFVDSQYRADIASSGRGIDYAGLQIDVAGKRGLAKVAAGNRS